MNITDDQLLWIVLAILLALIVIVGPKADAHGVTLKDNAGYKRPMLALEMNAGEAPNMFTSWNDDTKGKLREALKWDFLFIVFVSGIYCRSVLFGSKIFGYSCHHCLQVQSGHHLSSIGGTSIRRSGEPCASTGAGRAD
jgi:hypothetical protein